MFNLFKKKEDSLKIIDKVWMTEAAKLQAFVEEWKKDNTIFYVFWFDETLRNTELFFSKEIPAQAQFITAREATAHSLTGKTVIFAEHYPLHQKEKELFEKLNLGQAQIWSSLDEPLFKHFGGEKIVHLMKQLGMKENESVEHKMLSKAVQNAQEKIQKKVVIEQTAYSQKDWIEKNLPG
jgi:hypothetical protein